MISTRENHCRTCQYFLGGRTCKAFAEFIPDDLWDGINLHNEAYANDGGYRYKRSFDGFPPLPERFFDVKPPVPQMPADAGSSANIVSLF